MDENDFINLRHNPKNEKCLDCLDTCKQSNKVVIVKCPNYRKKERTRRKKHADEN